jgi:cysteine sulfinate desulfinase/cysteine desulfurase-like protein
MLPYITQHFGNPSSSHELGQAAKAAVEKARIQVAALLNAEPDEIYFTSGGSEANNTAIKGTVWHSGETAASPVLQAMGLSSERGRGAVRFSLGRYTKKTEINQVISQIEKVIKGS